MPDDLGKVTLGKRVMQAGSSEELNNVIQVEHVRNYAFSQHQNEAKDEFIIQIDNATKQIKMFPVQSKVAL